MESALVPALGARGRGKTGRTRPFRSSRMRPSANVSPTSIWRSIFGFLASGRGAHGPSQSPLQAEPESTPP